jgi:hypothetical protein
LRAKIEKDFSNIALIIKKFFYRVRKGMRGVLLFIGNRKNLFCHICLQYKKNITFAGLNRN